MAARFFVNGGVNNNWGDTSNWSTTSGGAGGQTVPALTDAVTLDQNSPNCIVDGTTGRNAGGLDFTNYTNQLTLNNLILNNGSLTLGAGMKPILGMGSFSFTSAGTKILTSNGIVIPNLVLNAVSPTISLADNLYISGMIYMASTNNVVGGKTIYVMGGCCFVGGASATSITGALILLNPVKMSANGALAALNNKTSFVGYNQTHQ